MVSSLPSTFLLLLGLLVSGSHLSEQVSGGPQSQSEIVQAPPASDQAMQFYRSGMVAWGARVIISFLIPAVILFSGFSARLRTFSEKLSRGVQLGTKNQRARGVTYQLSAGVYAALYLTITALCLLPLEWYQFFLRYHEYGLSNQSFLAWSRDTLLTFLLALGAVVLIAPGVFFFLKASPQRWWLYTTIGAVLTVAALSVVFPVWIAPLYDDFGPMQDKQLESDIVDLARRARIEGGRVFEVNKSEDTEMVNAYVTGLFNTKRIVLWDTLIEKLDRDEILFVMGHEMGHYALHHTWKILGLTSALIVLSLYAIHRTSHILIGKFKERFGFDRPDDVASVPLFLLIGSVVSIVATPMSLAYNRHVEHESDRFSLELNQNNRAAATTWLALQRENLRNPDPGIIFRTWRATHPVLSDRVAFANSYRPWENNEPLKYAYKFAAH